MILFVFTRLMLMIPCTCPSQYFLSLMPSLLLDDFVFLLKCITFCETVFGLDACSLMVSVYGVFFICKKKCGLSVFKREQNMLLRRNKAGVLKITVWFVVIFVLNKVSNGKRDVCCSFFPLTISLNYEDILTLS